MIISVSILFISVSLLNICNANMLFSCGHSWRAYLKRISERGGKLLYFPMASVFCYMASFIFVSFQRPAQKMISYLLLGIAFLLCAMYCYKRKDFMKLRGEALPVFLVSEVILVIICAAGYFSGGAILAIMFILSIFTSGLADHIFLCMTKKDRLKKYKNFTAFQDKKRICILNSTQIDVVETLRAMLSSSYSCAVFEDIAPVALFSEEPPAEDICLFSSGIYSAKDTSELLFATNPDILIVIGSNVAVSNRLIEQMKTSGAEIYTDNAGLIAALNCMDITQYENLGLGLEKKENEIAAMCEDICLSLGLEGGVVKNTLQGLLG